MIGETLGTYRIISEIGTGGMGVVYLAEHTLLGRKAAVKVLRPELVGDHVERFFNEARAAATLQHAGLVDVYDFGHHTNGAAYIVMEFLPGESLAERLEHEPRFPPRLACTIARSVANALHAAHEQGIIHRDLKPGNIFLVPDPEAAAGVRPKVLDFGIAKLVRDHAPRSVHTHSGAVIGTPRYMSPEQCKSARTVDGRSDVYSLGCILYEMLTGVAPFDYDSWAELVAAHLHEHPPRPRELDASLPVEVEAIVLRALAKKPEERFQSMEEVSRALETVLQSAGDAPMRASPIPALRKSAPRVGRDHSTPRDAAASDPTLPAAKATGSNTDPTPPISGELSTPRKPIPARYWAIGGIAIGAVGLGAVMFAMNGRTSPPTEPAFIVVDERGKDELPPADAAEPVVAIVADAAVAEPAPIDAAPARPSRPATEPDELQLTRAFSKQNAAITRCFLAHADAPANDISVRFQIDVEGRVKTATVLPEAVAASPLGACLGDLARGTAFGKQAKPLTFRVPIHRRAPAR